MKQALVLSLITLSAVSAFAPSQIQPCRSSIQMNVESNVGRRAAFSKIFGGAALIASQPVVANALDMDAFMNAELANDTKNCDPKRDPKCLPPMTSDQASCKYGQGKAKSEACKRIRESGKEVPKESGGKSLGGAYAM